MAITQSGLYFPFLHLTIHALHHRNRNSQAMPLLHDIATEGVQFADSARTHIALQGTAGILRMIIVESPDNMINILLLHVNLLRQSDRIRLINQLFILFC